MCVWVGVGLCPCMCEFAGMLSATGLTNTLNTIIHGQRRERETGSTSEGRLSGVFVCVCV